MISTKETRILESVFAQVRKIIDADRFYAALYDRVNVQLTFPVLAEKRNGSLEILPRGPEQWDHPYRPNEQVPDFLLTDGKPLLVEDNFEDWIRSRNLTYDFNSEIWPSSWLGVPLLARGRAVGAIVLERYARDHSFDERDLQFLSAIANRASGTLSNMRLMESLRIVQDVGQELTSEIRLSVDGILNLIHKQLGRLMNVSDMYVALYDRGTKILSFPFAMYNGKREDWSSRKVEGVQGLTEKVLLDPERKPLNPDDVAQWYKDNDIEPRVKPVPKSWVGVPLVSGEQVLGVISLQNDEVEGLYSDDDVEVLQLIAGQAAVALANTRLVKRLNVVNEVGQALAGGINLSLDEILELIYEQTCPLMDTRNMYIAMYDESAQILSFPFAMYNGKREDWSSRKVEGVQGLTEKVLLDPERKPLNPTNVAQWYEVKGIKPKDERIPKSWVGVPIVSGEHILGVIALQNDEVTKLYKKDDVELLRTLAGQSAVAIENARLYSDLSERTKQLESRNQQLAALQEIGVKITSQFSLEEVLGSIAENVNRVMSADFSTIFPYDSRQNEFGKGVRKGVVQVEPSIPSSDGYSANIAKTQGSIFIENAKKYQNVNRIFIENKHVRSFIGTPLIYDEKTVGVLYVNYRNSHAFSEEEKRILKLFANQAAVAIENVRKVNEITNRERELVMSGLAMDFMHTINNLAGPIIPWVTLAQKSLSEESRSNPKVVKYLDNIIRDTSLILTEAHELRRPNTEYETIDIEEVLGSIIGQLEMMVDKDTDITLVSESNLPPIWAVRRQLSTAFYSVVQNATKAVSDQGKIGINIKYIQMDDREDCIQIDISDTGCGIPQDKLKTIFEFGTSYWKDGSGTGYGLWRARNIVRSMGGEITAKNNLDAGCTFTILVPVSAKSYDFSSKAGGDSNGK